LKATSIEKYRGRFAPSPTGPLHLGSMITAVASYLQAKSQDGHWLLRMDDIDTPRVVTGATDAILHTLIRFKMHWDESIVYQSQQQPHYQAALEQLAYQNNIYHCLCSRKHIASIAKPGPYGPIYPGKCQHRKQRPGHDRSAIRLNTNATRIIINDKLQGSISQNIQQDIGDFVIQRADGIFSYQLSVVVDDYQQAITEIVRGFDLLDSTPRQVYLQQLLHFPTPSYAHIPILVNPQGQKLSKQNFAAAVPHHHPEKTLLKVFQLLGLNPPTELQRETLDTLWCWAIEHWQLTAIPRVNTIMVNPEDTPAYTRSV